jgi:serine/threonine-protein kinase
LVEVAAPMDRERWQQVRDVLAAVEARPAAERPAVLAALCGEDVALRSEVESLLEAAASPGLRSGRAVEEIAPELDASTAAPHEGARVGPYRLGERIGQGGMGAVFAAERSDGQFQQTAAIKLLAVGFADATTVSRFRTEREILARLEHPNIARLLDGGVTEQGSPYLVMEYVRGEPVTEFCDRKRLPLAERLRLFQQICLAVQYAHQNLVVHRDLKPSNILVSERGEVKLLDFGIAKLLEPGRTTPPLEATRTVGRWMTPAFASPEQVRGEAVTTATDVYALGLLLYELLTGRRAQPVAADLPAGELERRICETDVERASAAVLGGADAAARAESRGGMSPQRLGRLLRGDLDTIVSKAMQKEPGRRYVSAAELADDVARHLQRLPVRARRDTLAYRASRFARRHRFGVAAAGAALAALIAFSATTAVQAARIAREAEAKSRVTEFLTDLFKVSDPAQGRSRTITARELLDQGAAKIRNSLQHEPEIQAGLMATMGSAYLNLGLYAEAEQQAKVALETRRRVLGPEHPHTLQSMTSVAFAYSLQGRHAEAEALLRETLGIQTRVLGLEHADTAKSMFVLADALREQERYAEAEALFRETLGIQTRVLGPEHQDTLRSRISLTNTLSGCSAWSGCGSDLTARAAEVEALERETLGIQTRVLGPQHPDTLKSRMNLAVTIASQGRKAEAEAFGRETLGIQTRVLGPEHPATLLSKMNLADAIASQGRYTDAEALHRETLAVRQRVLGPDHPETVNSIYNLAAVAALQGKRAEALSHLRDAIERGFHSPDIIEGDPDLATLRGDPEFQKLVTAARENQRRLRARGAEGS